MTSPDWWGSYPLPHPAPGSTHVRMNFVTSADGAATLDGRSGGLGGSSDRELMRVLRTLADVMLVGAGTVRAEGYGGLNLPQQHLERRAALGFAAPPRIAVVSRALDLTPDMSVFHKSEMRPLVFTCEGAPSHKRDALSSVADVIACGSGGVDLQLLMQELAARGLSRVLCEGGPTLFGSLLEDDLVDEVCLTVSPLFTAGASGRIAHSATAAPRRFGAPNVVQDDEGFVFLRYAR